MVSRREHRIPRALPVRIWGLGENARPFVRAAHTVDVSPQGVRLAANDFSLRLGQHVGLQHGKRQGQFRVLWIGAGGSRVAGQAGLRAVESQPGLWGQALPPMFNRRVTDAAAGAEMEALPPLEEVWSEAERRGHRRCSVEGRALVYIEGSRFPLSGVLIDLSPGGCYADLGASLDPGARVRLVLIFDHDEVHVRGEVRLCQPMLGVGIAFRELTGAAQERINAFCARQDGHQ